MQPRAPGSLRRGEPLWRLRRLSISQAGPLCTQASLSSVPLCVGELFSAAGLEALVEASKPPFVLLFLLLRTAYWPYVSAGFWQDSLWALAKPRDRAHSLVAYAALLGANVFLTGLQVFWTGQICAAVGEALGQQ